MASGEGYRRIYGDDRLAALAAAYRDRAERTLFVEADGSVVAGCGFDTRRESSPAARPARMGLRVRAVEALRALRGISPRRIASDELYLAFLAVDADHRRRGFAGLLLRAAEVAARSRGLARVTAIVDANNREALAFYAAHGYEAESGSSPVVRVAKRSGIEGSPQS